MLYNQLDCNLQMQLEVSVCFSEGFSYKMHNHTPIHISRQNRYITLTRISKDNLYVLHVHVYNKVVN